MQRSVGADAHGSGALVHDAGDVGHLESGDHAQDQQLGLIGR